METPNLFSQVLQCFDDVLATCSPSARAYCDRAVAHNLLGQHNASIDDCTRSIAIFPSSFAYSTRGYSKTANGDHEGAIKDLSRAIDLSSDNADAYNGRALAESRLNMNLKALDDYTQALKYTQAAKLSSLRVAAYKGRAKVYEKLGKKALAGADRNMNTQILGQ